MREIKFRVWDTGLERFVSSEYLYMNIYGEVTAVFDNGRDVEDFTDNKQAVVMQYTGLKDKNGKEVYEGDIVKFMYNSRPQREHIGKVEWNNHDLSWYFDGIFIENTPRKTMEIIGNIYENPELLEEQE